MLLQSLKDRVLGRPVSVAPPPLLPAEPAPSPVVVAPAPFEGYVDELSPQHVYGWVRDLSQPGARVAYELLLGEAGPVLGQGIADQFGYGLAGVGVGDGAHAFWHAFEPKLSEAERSQVVVRPLPGGNPLPRAPAMLGEYQPLLHVAMDIVNNCNLRCPFCLYDYERTHTTHLMTQETLDAALRFLPYARDGEFWFSCLHEPTLHPQLMAFVERVPTEHRRKLFYTTNLAKRMPASYFAWLAGNGMHHINVSIESRDPAIYERMRKGARHRIFQQNWDALMVALEQAPQPTRIRYICMVYKSNLRELPELARYLLGERHAWQVEFRYTFDVPWIPLEFRAAEYLDAADWAWASNALASLPPERVRLILPPPEVPAGPEPESAEPAWIEADERILPGRTMFRLSWDGALKVVGVLAASRFDIAQERVLLETNIRDVADPEALFRSLSQLTDVAVMA